MGSCMDKMINMQGMSENLVLIYLLELVNASRCEGKQFSQKMQEKLCILYSLSGSCVRKP